MMPVRSIDALVGIWCLTVLGMPLGCQKNVTPADVVDPPPRGAMTENVGTTSDEGELADKSATVAGSPMGGAKAWADNCMRCHNIRRPNLRSDHEWAAIVHHMRVRAYLTPEEHRLILDFLQAAN